MSQTTASRTRFRYAPVRVHGTLSAVRPDDQTFALAAPDGATIPGWYGECRPPADLTPLLNVPVVLVGVGRFDKAGRLVCVAASGVFPAGGQARRPGLTAGQRREVVRRYLEGFGPDPEWDEAG